MTKQITFRTSRGATVTIHASDTGSLSADVNGKPHTSFGVALAHDREAGQHVALAGKVKAQIADGDLAKVREFFAAAAANAAYIVGYQPTAMDRHYALIEDMDRANSDN